jgi:hypothetical protein
MQFELKMLSEDAVSRALAKAERYRLLNEPGEAESICLDALAVDPSNQSALTTLLLALTEQFGHDPRTCVTKAWEAVAQLRDDYERTYYTGLIHERRAKAQLHHESPGSGPLIYDWLRQAMDWYERAEAIRPGGNDDAILRWNACARLIMSNRGLAPRVERDTEPLLLE